MSTSLSDYFEDSSPRMSTQTVKLPSTRSSNTDLKYRQLLMELTSLKSEIQYLRFQNMQTRDIVMIDNFSSFENKGKRGGEATYIDHALANRLYAIILNNTTARSMVNQIKDEIFREGIKPKEKFVQRCLVCNTEYNHKITKCEECGNTVKTLFLEPSLDEKERLNTLISKPVNSNMQLLIEVLEELELDLDIIDDCFLVARWEYEHISGIIQTKNFLEARREFPSNIRFSVDEYNRIGNYEMTCLEHRNVSVLIDDIQKGERQPFCPICGAQLHRVIAVRYRPGTHEIQTRFIKGEIFHTSKYSPTSLYGYPPALTLKNLLELIHYQELYMSMYYRHRKLPSVGLGIPTKNSKDVQDFKKEIEDALQNDRLSVPVFKYDPQSGSPPVLIRFDDKPQEMDFIEVRQEARMRMSAFYGVSPLFQNDLSAASGLNNEILQIEVQNRTITKGQTVLKRGIIDPFIRELGFQDWEIDFGRVEKDDEKKEIELDILRDQHAINMQSLGFIVDRDPNGNFVFKKVRDPNDEEAQEIFEAHDENNKDNKSVGDNVEKKLKQAKPRNIGTSRLKGDYSNDQKFSKA